MLKGLQNAGVDVPGIAGNDTASDEKIQEEIDTFVEDSGNTVNLKVSEGHKPGSAVWLNGGNGSCYSTNEAVVTVSSGGNMYNIHKYTVD